MILAEGNSIILTCYSHTIPRWNRHNNLDINPQHFLIGYDLVINEVVETDTGMYRCHGTMHNLSLFTATSEIHVGGK